MNYMKIQLEIELRIYHMLVEGFDRNQNLRGVDFQFDLEQLFDSLN